MPKEIEVLRFRQLRERGIVSNWPTLLDWIARQGFPPGIMLGPNTRGWFASEVYEWLASRPIAPKVVAITAAHISRRGRKTPEVAVDS